jgi:DME family drug/metabolite transporter
MDHVPDPAQTAADTAVPAARDGTLAVLAAALLWSTGGACIKALDGYSPWTVLSGRSLLSSLFFLVLLRGRPRLSSGAGLWPVAGAVSYGLVVTTFVLANRLTTAANAIILQYTSILWIALFGWLMVRERPNRREYAAMAVGVLGVALCVGHGLQLFVLASGEGSHRALLGDAVALASGFCFAITTVALRRIGKAVAGSGPQGGEPALVCLFYGNLLAGIIGLPWLVREIGGPGITGQDHALGWAVLAWLGFGQLGAGYWFYQQGLKTTRALTASLLSLAEPLVNPLLVFLTVRELPTPGTMAGGALVIVSLALTLTARPPSRSPG